MLKILVSASPPSFNARLLEYAMQVCKELEAELILFHYARQWHPVSYGRNLAAVDIHGFLDSRKAALEREAERLRLNSSLKVSTWVSAVPLSIAVSGSAKQIDLIIVNVRRFVFKRKLLLTVLNGWYLDLHIPILFISGRSESDRPEAVDFDKHRLSESEDSHSALLNLLINRRRHSKRSFALFHY